MYMARGPILDEEQASVLDAEDLARARALAAVGRRANFTEVPAVVHSGPIFRPSAPWLPA